jgi:AhpD family alkylhydroperoxidase
MQFAAAANTAIENVDMMLNWNAYREQLAAGIKEVGRLSPDTVRGYVELSSAGQKKDLLGAKIRELIALAVAVTARCDGCITVHSEAAIRHSASKEEIAEALGVAVAVNAGAALVYSTRTMDAVREYPREVSAHEEQLEQPPDDR